LSILVRFKLTQESKRARKEFQSKFVLTTLPSDEPPEQERQQQQQGQEQASWQDVYQFWATRPGGPGPCTNSTTCISHTSFIWDLMEPALTPLRNDAKQLVNDVLSLIGHVMKMTIDLQQLQPTTTMTDAAIKVCGVGGGNNNDTSNDSLLSLSAVSTVASSSSSCRPNFSRTLALQPMQAIWLVYFCLLPEARRQELLCSVPDSSLILSTTSLCSSGNDSDDKQNGHESGGIKATGGGGGEEEDDDEIMTTSSRRATAAREQLLATAETLRLFLEMQDE
jgi:hypothetical protein